MTKTKKQLRAEAVRRLRDTCMDSGSAVKKLAMALGSEWNPPSVNRSLGALKERLIYLLTDNEYECPSDPGEAGIACVDAFIAEHSNDDSAHESDVRTVSVDANDVKVSTMPLKLPSEIEWHYTDGGEYIQKLTGDSREKLEADVYRAADEMDRFYCGEKFIDTRKIIGWLDRQAAITKRECSECAEYNSHGWARANMGWAEANAEAERWRQKCDELTAERNHFRRHVDKLMEHIADIACKHPYTFDPEAPYETLDAIGDYIDELRRRNSELEAERCDRTFDIGRHYDKAMERIAELEAELERKQHVCDIQRESFLKIEAENAELRKELVK